MTWRQLSREFKKNCYYAILKKIFQMTGFKILLSSPDSEMEWK